MRKVRAVALAVLLSVPAGSWSMGNGNGHGRPQPLTCPEDVAAAIAERCRCDDQRNHGQYVRCVVRFRNALRKADCLDAEAKRTIARCAARSTCGKPTAVLCCFTQLGTCSDPTPGNLMAEGTCSDDVEVACDVDGDCSTTRARIARDEAACTASGGTPGGQGSVCGACVTSTTTTSSSTTSTLP